MQSEPKVRRSARARPVNAYSGEAPSSETRTADVSADTSSRTPKQQQSSAMPSRALTPRKTPISSRKKRCRPVSRSSNSTTDESSRDETEGDDEDEDPDPLQPKLTRLKAKQLNKKPLPIAPLNAPRPDAEVAALIQQELGSDDDDEEYKPTEDEIHSDEDPNTTISDIDSQPRTPATPATLEKVEHDVHETESCYTKDGLFKIPRPRNDSQCSHSEQEQENIARRTRSKLCLQTTAIETIESTFIPPDITTDMYDFDCDMDHVWKEFLSEFTKPLPTNAEDDDDTDPEYVAAGKIPIDREELREVKVSRKELNELVSELLECGLNDESFLDGNIFNTTPIANEDGSTQQRCQKTPTDQKNGEQFDQNYMQSTKASIAEQQIDQIVQINDTECPPSNALSNSSAPPIISEIIPSMGATCQSPAYANNTLSGGISSSSQPMILLNKIPAPNATSGLIYATAQPTLINRIPNVQQTSTQANLNNRQFFIQLSTIDHSSYRKYYKPSSTVPTTPVEQRGLEEPTKRRYRYNHNLVPVDVNIDEGQTGFNDFQLQLFQQQLRKHVQFAAQNFLQSYAHPMFWKLADIFKKMILELREGSVTNPLMKAWNLDAAVECCLSWESGLQQQTDENNELIQFLLEETDKANKAKQEAKYYQNHFHPKMMEKVVTNQAFMYPKLLPYIPFRMDLRADRIIKSEERLIAFGLELFFPIVQKKISESKFPKTEKPKLHHVCHYISKHLLPLHSTTQIYARIASRRRASETNPIQQFFVHSKAPPFQHILEIVDFDNVIPPYLYQQGELPHLWDKYIYSNPRLARINNDHTESRVSATKPIINRLSSTGTSDSNVNITISLVVDPIQNQQDSSYNSREDTYRLNSDYLDKSKQNSDQTIARYISEFDEELSFSSSTPFKRAKTVPKAAIVDEELPIPRKKCCKCDCHFQNKEASEPEHKSNSSKKVQKRLTDYFRFTSKHVLSSPTRRIKLKEKLWEIYQRYRDSCKRYSDWGSSALERVNKHFQLIESFSYFLDDLKKMSSGMDEKKSDGELPKSENSLINGTTRRIPKLDNVENKDANYAYNFFEKVEETLLGENKLSQYEKFLEILQTFNEKEDRVADLYCKIESLLIAEHPELVDLFLTFLLPGQAAEVGKFFEHFILTNANDFLAKLNIYFAKQPSQIKKIYSCINDLSNESDVTMEQIKSRILPLLKGNPLLIDWFLQLFPPEKPAESNLADYEVLSLKKLPPSDNTDPNRIYEDVTFVEAPSESVCGTKYIQGRIVYGTLPARLSFLAHDYVVPPSLQNDPSPIKGCVHNVRQADKTKGGADGEEKDHGDLVEANREDPPYKLCDDVTFKAHAIRLNPLVHGGKGTNYAEVAHLLVSDVDGAVESDTFSEEEKSTSPKKHSSIKTLPKKRINSPISKKPCIGKSSPPISKKSPPASVPPDSKVVAISKKLKSIIEAPTSESNAEIPPPPMAPVKRKPSIPVAVNSAPIPVKRERLTKKSSSDALPADEKIDEAESSDSNSIQTSWTRDEDKVILEEIKHGFSSVDELIQRIGGKIEGRHPSEIESRYEFLMEVLKKFQK
ncbi:uncharacterized protein LOC131684212 [Topomyia yanbarensis]|uniref:uncharacterized protein LOC131684212 n=1 Tax=Topomyia yanbarensis TaxID=2498891 RepID=UPI00273AF3B3|nr:uncharacterized protein LOC131684212 [Topomyia yanbarensis]